MPLPVIGSVLFDGGQALPNTARKEKGFTGVKKDFWRCNKMALLDVMATVCTRRWPDSGLAMSKPGYVDPLMRVA